MLLKEIFERTLLVLTLFLFWYCINIFKELFLPVSPHNKPMSVLRFGAAKIKDLISKLQMFFKVFLRNVFPLNKPLNLAACFNNCQLQTDSSCAFPRLESECKSRRSSFTLQTFYTLFCIKKCKTTDMQCTYKSYERLSFCQNIKNNRHLS